MAFLVGIVGGAGHCTLMCGGIVLAFERLRPENPGRPLWQAQAALHVGRVATYIALAVALALVGDALMRTEFIVARKSWQVLMGTILLALALSHLLGRIFGHRFVAPISKFIRGRLKNTRHQLWPSFTAGLAWGLIPCMFSWPVIVAAATRPAPEALGLITAFGMGTVMPLGLLQNMDMRLGLRWRNAWGKATSIALAGYGMMLIASATGVGHHAHHPQSGLTTPQDLKEQYSHGHHH